uniref:Groucho/TLE N-terminal Q-rich domain-containing protein n=1 Tax=Phlebotomus papatasi TaxID=29031 RepID=A0A1B0CZ65_PHLPP
MRSTDRYFLCCERQFNFIFSGIQPTSKLYVVFSMGSHQRGIGWVDSKGPPQPGQPFKFTVVESCDRIKEEFNFLQAQYHNLKMECEKLAQEKTEMQRHYVMYYEMSYGLNVEMHKQ